MAAAYALVMALARTLAPEPAPESESGAKALPASLKRTREEEEEEEDAPTQPEIKRNAGENPVSSAPAPAPAPAPAAEPPVIAGAGTGPSAGFAASPVTPPVPVRDEGVQPSQGPRTFDTLVLVDHSFGKDCQSALDNLEAEGFTGAPVKVASKRDIDAALAKHKPTGVVLAFASVSEGLGIFLCQGPDGACATLSTLDITTVLWKHHVKLLVFAMRNSARAAYVAVKGHVPVVLGFRGSKFLFKETEDGPVGPLISGALHAFLVCLAAGQTPEEAKENCNATSLGHFKGALPNHYLPCLFMGVDCMSSIPKKNGGHISPSRWLATPLPALDTVFGLYSPPV